MMNAKKGRPRKYPVGFKVRYNTLSSKFPRIVIRPETHKRLHRLKQNKTKTFDDVITYLLNNNESQIKTAEKTAV